MLTTGVCTAAQGRLGCVGARIGGRVYVVGGSGDGGGLASLVSTEARCAPCATHEWLSSAK
jgi:hypothetical protein